MVGILASVLGKRISTPYTQNSDYIRLEGKGKDIPMLN
jgi:hypothetical protein